MHPRESIPNVGRRAQGRKALFMLKGSKVKDVTGDDGGGVLKGVQLKRQDDQKLSQPSDSVTMHRDPDDESSDGPDLSVWNHPYNRIIQKIMERHKVVRGHRFNSNMSPREVDQEDYFNQATPRAFSKHHSDDLSLDYSRTSQDTDRQRPAERGRRTDTTHSIERTRKMTSNATKDAEPHWQSSTERNARRIADGNQRQHRKHSPPDDLQPATFSFDPASGGFTTRCSQVSPPQPSSRHYGYGDSGLRRTKSPAPLDTTRSDPGLDAASARLSRLATNRKRESDPMDELLDYMWVYQGMGRQVLNLGLPRAGWDSRRLFRKHKKLPPILQGICPPTVAGREHREVLPTSARGESSGSEHRREKAEEHMFRSVERRSNSEPVSYILATKHPAFSSRSGFESRSGSEKHSQRGGSGDFDLNDGDADDGGQMFYDSASRGQVIVNSGPRGPVKLIVKMPAMLPPEMTRYSDMLDKD